MGTLQSAMMADAGYLKDLTGSFTAGLVYVVAMLIAGVVCMSIVAVQARVATTHPRPGIA